MDLLPLGRTTSPPTVAYWRRLLGEVGEYVICGPSNAGLPGRWLRGLRAPDRAAIDRTRRGWDVLVFSAPVDLVGEAQGAVEVGRAPVLCRAYDGRAARAFERASEDVLEQPAREAPSSERHARREVVDVAVLSLVEGHDRGRLSGDPGHQEAALAAHLRPA